MRIANSGVRDALLTAVAVVPGEDQDDRQADQECEESRSAGAVRGQSKVLADVLEALQESPGSGDVDHSPLHDLAAAQPGPGALGSTLCRRVGHSAAPMASECSGLSAGARGKQVHSDLKADTHAVSQRIRRNGANDGRAGSARESTSWESENLETCRASRSRFPGFQLFSFSPRRRPRRARPGAAGGRGGRPPVARARPEWPRRRRAGAGMASPMARLRRVPCGPREAR